MTGLLNKPSGLSIGAVMGIIWMTALTVFTGTTIYWNFGLVQKDLDVMESEVTIEVVGRVAGDIETNERIDKKTARNKVFIDALNERLNALEQPGSDK